jgi:hypothetical protein
MRNSYLNKWNVIVSDKRVTIAIIMIAVAARLIQTIYFFHLGVDRSFQSLAAYNFLEGHGVSIAHIYSNDLAAPVYKPLIKWPPGYSLLLAPFYILFNHNYFLAGFAVCFLSVLVLIYISRRILALLNTPVSLINIYTLLSAFFIPYFQFLTDTDGVATAGFLVALYFTLLLLRTKHNWKKQTALLTIFLFVCAFLKYLFIPLVFIPPAFLLAKGFADKDATLKKAGLMSFMVLFITVGSLLLYQKTISGTAAYISEPGRGFYPEHILDTYPLVPSAFLSLETIQRLFDIKGTEYNIVFRFYQCLYMLLLGLSVFYVAKNIFKNKFRKISVTNSFYYITFLLSLATIALLTVLSLFVAPEKDSGTLWTYVEDIRYYCLATVLIHIALFVFLYYCHESASLFRYYFYLLALFMLPELFRGVIFTVNRIKYFKTEQYTWQTEYEFSKYAGNIIEKEKLKTYSKIIITGSSWFLNNRVSLYNHVPIAEEKEINGLSSLNTSKPVTIVAIIRKDLLSRFQQLLSTNNKPVGYHSGYYFYTVHVNPR